MLYSSNLKKVGVMIRHFRNRKLGVLDENSYSQDSFLIVSHEHPFYDVLPGYPVCSRATLSRIENGKEIHEEELYRFFLRKLGLSYRFSLNAENAYAACFNAIDKQLLEGTLIGLDELVVIEHHPDNVLYAFYDELILHLHTFFKEGVFPRLEKMDQIADLWFCVPQSIRPAFHLMFSMARGTHPFYDQIKPAPSGDYAVKHPLVALVYALNSIEEQRYALCHRILNRFENHPQSGELFSLFLSTLDRYFEVSTSKHKLKVESLDSIDHPFHRLVFASLFLRLGKDAIDQRAYTDAIEFFEPLMDCQEPFCIFAAIVTEKPCATIDLMNPKLRIIQYYLIHVRSWDAALRLEFLTSVIPEILGETERFMNICFKREIIGLVSETRRYKSLFDFILKTETL